MGVAHRADLLDEIRQGMGEVLVLAATQPRASHLDTTPEPCVFGVERHDLIALVAGQDGRGCRITPLPQGPQATFRDFDEANASRTLTPSLASISIKASVLNRSSLPRRRSLTRG